MRFRNIFTKQDKTIYIWKLNLDGTLSKSAIDEYRITKYPGGTEYYLFRMEGSSSTHSLRSSQMDRFVSNRYASFTNDDEKAIKAIDDCLSAKAKKYKDDYESASSLIKLLRDNN